MTVVVRTGSGGVYRFVLVAVATATGFRGIVVIVSLRCSAAAVGFVTTPVVWK